VKKKYVPHRESQNTRERSPITHDSRTSFGTSLPAFQNRAPLSEAPIRRSTSLPTTEHQLAFTRHSTGLESLETFDHFAPKNKETFLHFAETKTANKTFPYVALLRGAAVFLPTPREMRELDSRNRIPVSRNRRTAREPLHQSANPQHRSAGDHPTKQAHKYAFRRTTSQHRPATPACAAAR